MPWPVILTAAAGLVSAAFFLSPLSGALGTFALLYFAQLPLFVVGLALGLTPAALAASAAFVICAVISSVIVAASFAIMNALPVLLMTRQALLNRTAPDGSVEWYPPGLLVAWLCGLAIAGFTLALVAMAGYDGGLEAYVRDEFVAVFSQVPREAAGNEMLPNAAGISRYLPGIAATSWIVMTAINGAAAQGIATRWGHARRPAPRMAQLELPSWIIGAAAIAGIGTLMPGAAGFVGVNVLMILVAGFVFAGLAVVHAVCQSLTQRRWWLAAVYLLALFMPWLVLAIGLIGILEPWTNLRGRFAGSSGER